MYASIQRKMEDFLPSWYPHEELNLDQRFRKPLLYPFELWGQATDYTLVTQQQRDGYCSIRHSRLLA
jgi:hypothetical protein